MRLVFSNISYLLKTKSTFFYLPFKFFLGSFESPKNLKIAIGKFYQYCLKFSQMMPHKSSFQTALIIKALVWW